MLEELGKLTTEYLTLKQDVQFTENELQELKNKFPPLPKTFETDLKYTEFSTTVDHIVSRTAELTDQLTHQNYRLEEATRRLRQAIRYEEVWYRVSAIGAEWGVRRAGMSVTVQTWCYTVSCLMKPAT